MPCGNSKPKFFLSCFLSVVAKLLAGTSKIMNIALIAIHLIYFPKGFRFYREDPSWIGCFNRSALGAIHQ